jgi:hypothetical protein
MSRSALGLALVVVLTATSASAATINAIDSGWYSAAGTHIAQNQNYIAGESADDDERRNFLVFDLTALTSEITSASLLLYNPDNALPALKGYVSPDPTETYRLHQVDTAIATLTASNVGAAGMQIFDDLGTGTVFGERVVSAADNGTTVAIALNADGIAALNAARGGLFAVGGAISTLGSPGAEYVFGFSVAIGNPDVRQLELETASVPEPTMMVLLGSAAVLAARRRWRL